jgi:hypothetical protein
MLLSALWVALLTGLLSATSAAPPPRRPASSGRQYTLAKLWQANLGPSELAWLAVCADGRSYLVTRSTRLVILSPSGRILEDDAAVPALASTNSAACGPGDTLYAAGSHFAVLSWRGPGALSTVSDSLVPLATVTQISVSTNGNALLRGFPKPGGAVEYIVRRDGATLAPVRGAGRGGATPGAVLRVSLTFDASGDRFVEVPWDSYEFKTYGVLDRSSHVFPRGDPSFRPASPGAREDGDVVVGVVSLPGGRFATRVVKRAPNANGVTFSYADYLEIFDAAFHVVGTNISRLGVPGELRGADGAGNLYFLVVGVPGQGRLAVVKARLEER